ncbi:MAG TPA: FUSC family protein [Pedococcus sp.]
MSTADRFAASAAALARSQAQARSRRLLGRIFFIVQCGVGAALAWEIASALLHHPRPFFAPVTAIVSLGMSFGQRLRRSFEVMGGVALGVFVGDAFVHVFGTGVLQIVVVVVVAMSLAALLGAGLTLTMQAGVQSVIVTTLLPQSGQVFTRWLDAVVGGSVALLLTLFAPASSFRRPRQQAAAVLREVSAVLGDTARAVATGDGDLARATLTRARDTEQLLTQLRDFASEGIAVVRLSPLRRRHLPGVQAIADLVEPLDRAVRNLRVLVRRTRTAAWRGEAVPPAYIGLVQSLSDATADMARELEARRPPTNTRAVLARIGADSARADPEAGLSGEVVRAQVRSMVVDLLMLTGLSYEEAREQVPDARTTGPGAEAG